MREVKEEIFYKHSLPIVKFYNFYQMYKSFCDAWYKQLDSHTGTASNQLVIVKSSQN